MSNKKQQKKDRRSQSISYKPDYGQVKKKRKRKLIRKNYANNQSLDQLTSIQKMKNKIEEETKEEEEKQKQIDQDQQTNKQQKEQEQEKNQEIEQSQSQSQEQEQEQSQKQEREGHSFKRVPRSYSERNPQNFAIPMSTETKKYKRQRKKRLQSRYLHKTRNISSGTILRNSSTGSTPLDPLEEELILEKRRREDVENKLKVLRSMAEELLNENQLIRSDNKEKIQELRYLKTSLSEEQEKNEELVKKTNRIEEKISQKNFQVESYVKKIGFLEKELVKYEKENDRLIQKKKSQRNVQMLTSLQRTSSQPLFNGDKYHNERETKFKIIELQDAISELKKENLKLEKKQDQLLSERNQIRIIEEENYNLKLKIEKKEQEYQILNVEKELIQQTHIKKEMYDQLNEEKQLIENERKLVSQEKKEILNKLEDNLKEESKLRKEIERLNGVIDLMNVKYASETGAIGDELKFVQSEHQIQTLSALIIEKDQEIKEYNEKILEQKKEITERKEEIKKIVQEKNQINDQYQNSNKLIEKLKTDLTGSENLLKRKSRVIEKLRDENIGQESQIRDIISKSEKKNQQIKKLKEKKHSFKIKYEDQLDKANQFKKEFTEIEKIISNKEKEIEKLKQNNLKNIEKLNQKVKEMELTFTKQQNNNPNSQIANNQSQNENEELRLKLKLKELEELNNVKNNEQNKLYVETINNQNIEIEKYKEKLMLINNLSERLRNENDKQRKEELKLHGQLQLNIKELTEYKMKMTQLNDLIEGNEEITKKLHTHELQNAKLTERLRNIQMKNEKINKKLLNRKEKINKIKSQNQNLEKEKEQLSVKMENLLKKNGIELKKIKKKWKKTKVMNKNNDNDNHDGNDDDDDDDDDDKDDDNEDDDDDDDDDDFKLKKKLNKEKQLRKEKELEITKLGIEIEKKNLLFERIENDLQNNKQQFKDLKLKFEKNQKENFTNLNLNKQLMKENEKYKFQNSEHLLSLRNLKMTNENLENEKKKTNEKIQNLKKKITNLKIKKKNYQKENTKLEELVNDKNQLISELRKNLIEKPIYSYSLSNTNSENETASEIYSDFSENDNSDVNKRNNSKEINSQLVNSNDGQEGVDNENSEDHDDNDDDNVDDNDNDDDDDDGDDNVDDNVDDDDDNNNSNLKRSNGNGSRESNQNLKKLIENEKKTKLPNDGLFEINPNNDQQFSTNLNLDLIPKINNEISLNGIENIPQLNNSTPLNKMKPISLNGKMGKQIQKDLKKNLTFTEKVRKKIKQRTNNQKKQHKLDISEITSTFKLIQTNRFFLEMFYALILRLKRAGFKYLNPSIPSVDENQDVETIYEQMVNNSNMKLDIINEDVHEFMKRTGMKKKHNLILDLISEETQHMKMINLLSLRAYRPVFEKIRSEKERYQKELQEQIRLQKKRKRERRRKKKLQNSQKKEKKNKNTTGFFFRF
ncbi:fip1-like 1 protein [Anaeramoeba flamelloides]|uniref:Fip1-like 1 protein n=1 Tax=Anaeramoeba flamelloides TaxID=1746091 RepID=A0AAV7ZBD8_9EUKA|nr:fip1-like 1 protein [Anaeramoeba flamelloides]